MSAPDASTVPAEVIVHRPDPGLARGKWEAPPWLFLLATVAVIAIALVYLAHRTGKLRNLPGFGGKR